MSNIENLLVPLTATIETAFRTLNSNKAGIVFAINAEGRVAGALTDGDIRRRLLQVNDLQASVSTCMTRDFVSAKAGTSRENILKLLDARITTVPIIGDRGELVDVVTRDVFRLSGEGEVFARARAPARITFGGGGTDLTHYFDANGGMVINATIAKFVHATLRLRMRSDLGVSITSHDLNERVEAAAARDLAFDGKLDLVKSIIMLIEPKYGFDLEISSEFPAGSGLGGSSVVAAAVIGCFNSFRADPWNRHEIAEMAFQAERLILKIAGGWQDQYAAVFGGFNFMEFTAEQNVITPMRLEARVMRELEESLILCYTGKNHNSGNIHVDQKARMLSSAATSEIAETQKQITLEMKKQLLRGRLEAYGDLMHQAWTAKKKHSPLISTPELDAAYDKAIDSGALGGKLLGAGGGGYFLFFAPPFGRHRICAAMSELGYESNRVLFDENGLQTWKVRVNHD